MKTLWEGVAYIIITNSNSKVNEINMYPFEFKIEIGKCLYENKLVGVNRLHNIGHRHIIKYYPRC